MKALIDRALANGRWVGSLLFLLIFGLVLHRTRGQYEYARDVLWLFAAWLAFVLAAHARAPLPMPPRWATGALAALYLAFSFRLAQEPLLLYGRPAMNEALLPLLGAHRWAAMLVVIFGLGAARETRWRRPFFGFALASGSMLIAARVLVLLISPRPDIDVYTTVDRAIDVLFGGHSPYGASYRDIYQGRYDYEPGMVYPPGALLSAALGRALTGDLRSAYLFADVLGAGGLLALSRTLKVPAIPASLLALVWLSFPVSLFVVEQGFIDPLLFPLAALLAWSIAVDRPIVAGLCLGLLAATKQYGVLAVVPWAASLLARRSWRGWAKTLGAGLAIGTVVVGPFFLATPSELWSSTVVLPFSYLPRKDALTLSALLRNELDLALPSLVAPGLLIAAIGISWARSRRGTPVAAFSVAMVVIFGATFLGAKQAFCNYYQLLAYFSALAAVTALGDDPPARSRPPADEPR